nr:hypothetical protein [Vibrio coralliirubri]
MLNPNNEVDFFAAISELSLRSVGLLPHPVQIVASLSCFKGNVIDMKTGEGKTLVATLAAIALAKKGYIVNVATANNYLAERDYLTMKPLYDICGVSVSRLSDKSLPPSGTSVYYANLTEEACLSWLADHLASDLESITHPQLLSVATSKTALIVDEIDQSLIESSAVNYSIVSQFEIGTFYQQIAELCKNVHQNESFTQFDKNGESEFTESFYQEVEKLFIDNGFASVPSDLYGDAFELMIHFRAAYTAMHVIKESEDYVVRSGEICRIDKRTGRLIRGGFVGTVSAYLSYKHGLPIPSSNLDIISCALQHYVKSFDLLSGMSGTAALNSLEIKHSYGINTLSVPENKSTQRVNHGHMLFPSFDSLKNNVSKFLCKASRDGRPTLVVCASEAQAETIANILTQKAVNATLLTSANLEAEAEILSRAGEFGSMIITTRMCGRGTDIICQDKERGLLIAVIGVGVTTNDDQQVIGRTGRQGEKGDAYFFISAEDDIFKSSNGSALASSMLQNLAQEDITHINHAMTKAVSNLVHKLQKQALSVLRERRKRVSIYNNPIDSQLKLLMKKREGILFSANPRQMFDHLIPNRPTKQIDLINHYEMLFGGKDAFDAVLRKGMAEGLTKSWNRHHMNLVNIKMDITGNSQAASNINNFKKSCFEAFSVFALNVNKEMYEYTMSYLQKASAQKLSSSTFMPTFHY